MNRIGPSELDDRLSSDDAFVLDVRPAVDYRRDHVAGSYNVPVYEDLRQGDTESLDAHLAEIPDGQRVVTVCKAGIVARKATAHLNDRGYEATTLTGGFRGWRHYRDRTVLYRVASLLRRLVP
ncbi:rhodanese-like domain-containing protein [Haloarcula nitratireducens]|uniref:Rhodanese-like domain-containing protein n=1 Tax=Haloarcula nitratireducens TaxID=2487749 RepID=A0AAW4P5T2_9EURY|nr:rhodanese-like domain-containing protein [Halomicroarcula nitratireducens]MBX0293301.1 rhodanese-like domain-containing protein [Halomicroarcula nitratireducens]